MRPTRCFAQRILNPFRGAMHVVQTEWADAVTTDGRNWILYVHGERLYEDLDADGDARVTVADVKYGSWSQAEGFHRAPIRHPTFEQVIQHEGDGLLAAVRQHADRLPFPFCDTQELWLLHPKTLRPLALVASAPQGQRRETPPLLRWTPGQLAMHQDARLFDLKDLVQSLTGAVPVAAWILRQPDGSGRLDETLNPPGCQTLPERFEADHFPLGDLALDNLPDAQASHAYQNWLSPCLLLLDCLDQAERRATEQRAIHHALRLVELLGLLPEVCQPELITRARVEARLRGRLGERLVSHGSDGEQSTFYLEVN